MAAKWARANKWDGEFKWWVDDEEFWVAPKSWKSGDGQLAAFYLDGEGNDTLAYEAEEDLFWLTRLCQKGRGGIGLRWWYQDGLGATASKMEKICT